MICIFGGTAAYHLTATDFGEHETLPPLDTPFGESSPFLTLSPPSPFRREVGGEGDNLPGVGVLFTSRHGPDHLSRSAAFINHRANLWAAKEYGATAILSWNGVGAINPTLQVGDMLVPDDLIDATRARTPSSPVGASLTGEEVNPPSPFGRGARGEGEIREVFSSAARAALISAIHNSPSPDRAVRSGEGAGGWGQSVVYVCTEGPRLETPAEINAFALMGAAVVGMTLVPEVFIAAEMGLPYASLCIVTNLAAGHAGPDSPRRFGVEVAREGLAVCLKAAQML